MIKILAIDVDGTLLNSKQQISQVIKETIRKKRRENVKFIICTGRPLNGVKKILADLEINGEDDYIISYNGAVVQNVCSEEVIYRKSLSFNEFLEVEALSYHLDVPFHVQSEVGVFTTNQDIGKYTVFDCVLNDSPLYYRNKLQMNSVPINKIMFADEPNRLETKIMMIPSFFYQKYTIVRSMDVFFEFLHKEAGKGNAVSFLSDYLKINRTEILAIGDNDNDISMLNFAGIGVAMGNGSEKLKASADYITKSNEEDGVAYALELFV